MNDMELALKAIADDTRLKIIKRLLRHSDCVRALARHLELSEAAVSQHLKVLREAGLLTGEKRGYFMHYDVDRAQLHALADGIDALAAIEREGCDSEGGAHGYGGCQGHGAKPSECCHRAGGGEQCHGHRDGRMPPKDVR